MYALIYDEFDLANVKRKLSLSTRPERQPKRP